MGTGEEIQGHCSAFGEIMNRKAAPNRTNATLTILQWTGSSCSYL